MTSIYPSILRELNTLDNRILAATEERRLLAEYPDLKAHKGPLFAKAATLNAQERVHWKADAAFYNTVLQQLERCSNGEITETTLLNNVPRIRDGARKKIEELQARTATPAAAVSTASIPPVATSGEAIAGQRSNKDARVAEAPLNPAPVAVPGPARPKPKKVAATAAPDAAEFTPAARTPMPITKGDAGPAPNPKSGPAKGARPAPPSSAPSSAPPVRAAAAVARTVESSLAVPAPVPVKKRPIIQQDDDEYDDGAAQVKVVRAPAKKAAKTGDAAPKNKKAGKAAGADQGPPTKRQKTAVPRKGHKSIQSEEPNNSARNTSKPKKGKNPIVEVILDSHPLKTTQKAVAPPPPKGKQRAVDNKVKSRRPSIVKSKQASQQYDDEEEDDTDFHEAGRDEESDGDGEDDDGEDEDEDVPTAPSGNRKQRAMQPALEPEHSEGDGPGVSESDEDVDELEAGGSKPTKKRTYNRTYAPTDELYKHPCDYCLKRSLQCTQPVGGGSCLHCKMAKVGCAYAHPKLKPEKVDNGKPPAKAVPAKRKQMDYLEFSDSEPEGIPAPRPTVPLSGHPSAQDPTTGASRAPAAVQGPTTAPSRAPAGTLGSGAGPSNAPAASAVSSTGPVSMPATHGVPIPRTLDHIAYRLYKLEAALSRVEGMMSHICWRTNMIDAIPPDSPMLPMLRARASAANQPPRPATAPPDARPPTSAQVSATLVLRSPVVSAQSSGLSSLAPTTHMSPAIIPAAPTFGNQLCPPRTSAATVSASAVVLDAIGTPAASSDQVSASAPPSAVRPIGTFTQASEGADISTSLSDAGPGALVNSLASQDAGAALVNVPLSSTPTTQSAETTPPTALPPVPVVMLQPPTPTASQEVIASAPAPSLPPPSPRRSSRSRSVTPAPFNASPNKRKAADAADAETAQSKRTRL